MKRITKWFVAITLILCGLTACQKKPVQTMPTTSASDYTASQTYALPGQPGYRGGAYAPYKNPLRAPANQVYYFAFDSSKVRGSDLRALQIQAIYLASHPKARIRLEGNTDKTGSREYNIGLGWRRVQAVVQLLKQQGVSARQIEMVSYGEERPAVFGDSENSLKLNRRVNLIYKVR